MNTLVHTHVTYKQDTISVNQYNIFFTPIAIKITKQQQLKEKQAKTILYAQNNQMTTKHMETN
jgi:hypothetical protein